jgi:tetratricopeptide (TPR) repeat protein
MKYFMTTGSTLCRGACLALLAFVLTFVGALSAQQDDRPDSEADNTSSLEISLELERRLQDIQRLEGELGLYHPSLIEMYDDLARFYQEHGEDEQAVDMFRQALQLARINTGLNSQQQLPYIDRLISSSLTLNDWRQADDMHHLRYYLKNRLYDPADPRFADAVAELGNWKLRVMRENLLDEGSRGLGNEDEELSRIYSQSIARIQASPEFQEIVLLPLYQGKSQVDLEIARLLSETPYQFFEGTVSRYIYESVCRNVRDAQGNVVRQCTRVQRENPRYRASQRDSKRMMVNRSVREVENSIQNLNTILARNPDISAREREQIVSQIRAFEVEFQRIERNSRRSLLY